MGHGGKRQNSGRKVGSKNKDNEFKAAIKEGIPVSLVLQEISSIKDAKDRVPHYIKLLEFAHPKMKSVEYKGEIEHSGDVEIRMIIHKDGVSRDKTT